ncbi:MAG: flagellar biosynthesis anti-sigma factor FlgM [Desulfobacteraceae bacterium]|nr:flagellar biosynthesis anti-sigma factor FlgM [Desulfobacteraceae bacterium]
MKINANNANIQMEAYLKQIRQQGQTSNDPPQNKNVQSAAQQTDKVELSSQGQEVQKAAYALKQMPEIREEKVQETKSEVDNGTYKVVGQQVATDMLRESLENDVVLHKVNMRV